MATGTIALESSSQLLRARTRAVPNMPMTSPDQSPQAINAEAKDAMTSSLQRTEF